MGYQIEYAYTSHIGRIRANNEDNFWCLGETMTADNQGTEGVRTGTAVQAQFPLMAVFDGMGGESCGEMAAFLAADACGRHYSEHKHELGSQPEQFLEELCRQMNRSVFEFSAFCKELFILFQVLIPKPLGISVIWCVKHNAWLMA